VVDNPGVDNPEVYTDTEVDLEVRIGTGVDPMVHIGFGVDLEVAPQALLEKLESGLRAATDHLEVVD